MSVPFCNTYLRVPQGFSAILEGLAREVLRDQPEDIPKYAAQYFEALLRQREDSGIDPAEWAAKHEDTFYENHAFKDSETSPEKAPETEVTASKQKSCESQAEDESSHSADAANLPTTQPNASEDADLTESTDEYEDQHNLTEEDSVNKLPAADLQPNDLSGTEEETDPTITAFDHVEYSAPDQDVPQPELERTDLLSFRGISNVDVCAQELRMLEDEEGGEQESVAVEEERADSKGEENTDVEQPVQVFPYSGLSDVDICATEFEGTERAMEGPPAEDDEDSSKHPTEEIEDEDQVEERKEGEGVETEAFSGAIYERLAPVEAGLDINDIPKAEAGAETEASSEGIHGGSSYKEASLDIKDIPKEEERAETEASSGGIHESSSHIEASLDNNPTPKEDSLVEISFDDVPEAQQFKDDEEKQPEEEGSVEVLQMLEMHQEEEFTEVSDVVTDENISSTQDHNQPDMMKVEQEVIFEGAEMESEQELSDIMKEKVDTNYSNLYDTDDDEKHEGVKTISSSHQPTTKADKKNPEEETYHKNEDNEKMDDSEFHQNEDFEKEAKSNDPDFKGDETTNTVGEDEEDVPTGYSEKDDGEIDEGSAENHSSQITHSEVSIAATEAEMETLEASAHHLAEVNGERLRTPVEPEDTVVEKEVNSKERSSEAEELVEEGMIDSELQEKSDATREEGSISLCQTADQLAADHHGEERPLGSEKESTEPEGKSGDKEDCSRAQEEEDIMDIPLDDPEANRAAAKIQAGFRGHMTRKKMKPEDKAEGEEVSSTGDVLNGSQWDTETGGSGAVERDDTSVPEQ